MDYEDYYSAPTTPPEGFDTETAMQWDCWHLDYEDPGLDAHDACEGILPYECFPDATCQENIECEKSNILGSTLVVVVEVYEDGSNYREEFVVAEMLCYLADDLPRLEESHDNFLGYRFYYFVPDSAGNRAHIARHVVANYYNYISLHR